MARCRNPELRQAAFSYSLCWANENWTRPWGGRDQEVLIAQHYSPAGLAHIQALLPSFHDPRYDRIQSKPLFLVYRSSALPVPAPPPASGASRPRAAASKSSIW